MYTYDILGVEDIVPSSSKYHHIFSFNSYIPITLPPSLPPSLPSHIVTHNWRVPHFNKYLHAGIICCCRVYTKAIYIYMYICSIYQSNIRFSVRCSILDVIFITSVYKKHIYINIYDILGGNDPLLSIITSFHSTHTSPNIPPPCFPHRPPPSFLPPILLHIIGASPTIINTCIFGEVNTQPIPPPLTRGV